MPVAIRTPRVNNNDDFVKFGHTFVSAGAAVSTGDPIAEIETDKATFTVEAERDGYLLGFVQPLGEMIAVGSVLGWMGDSPDAAIPAGDAPPRAVVTAEPTLKAALLLRKYSLNAADVPASGERLSVQDVLDYAGKHRLVLGQAARHPADEASPELPPGDRRPLSITERGMVKTVAWHRDCAVPGYVEVRYSTEMWDRYAEAFQGQYRLLLNPVLALMAHRLVQLARKNPKLNATISGNEHHRYASVNLGFTLQSGESLYLLAVKDADKLEEKAFVDALNLLMRNGMKGKLAADEIGGVTVGFSSMARWNVARHMPILAPYTSLMVAHAADGGQLASLGATYDHRVLTGGEVAAALQALSRPAAKD